MVIVGVMKTVLRLHSLTLHVTFTQRCARGDGTATGASRRRDPLWRDTGSVAGTVKLWGLRRPRNSETVLCPYICAAPYSVEYIAPPECRLPIKAVRLSSLLIRVIDLRIHPRYLCISTYRSPRDTYKSLKNIQITKKERTNHQKEHTHKSPSDKRSAVSDRLRTRVSHGGASRRSVVLFYICILLCSRGRIAIESR